MCTAGASLLLGILSLQKFLRRMDCMHDEKELRSLSHVRGLKLVPFHTDFCSVPVPIG